MARRGNGDGHIRKRKDGLWEGQYSVGYNPKTGKPIRRSVYAKKYREVSEKLSKKMSEHRNGVLPTFDKLTVAEWLDYFLWEIKKPYIKPKTFSGYADDIKYIKPYKLAQMKIGDVRRPHIQQFIKELESNGRPPFMVHRIYRTLRASFNEAERQNAIPVSYVNNVTLPKRTSKPIRTFSREEQSVFFDAIKGHRFEASFIIAITTGMREGEIAALTWDDYNDHAISVTKNIVCVSDYDPETHDSIGTLLIVQDTPKTRAGTRNIPLMPVAEQALSRHRMKQNNERMKYRLAYVNNGLIFCNQFGGAYTPHHFYAELQKVVESAGLHPIRFHELSNPNLNKIRTFLQDCVISTYSCAKVRIIKSSLQLPDAANVGKRLAGHFPTLRN
jgi:integrase